MLKKIFHTAVVVVLAVGSWLAAQAIRSWLADYLAGSPLVGAIIFYLAVIIVFGLVFGVYYRTPLDRLSATTTALIALVGIIGWQLLGPRTVNWSFAGWVVPVLLAGAVVYGRRELFRG